MSEPMQLTPAELAEREALFLDVMRLEQEFQRLESLPLTADDETVPQVVEVSAR